MSERFSVRPFEAGDEHGILALFNEVFAVGNPDFQPRSLGHWNWAFRDNPMGHDTFVATAEGRIVGLYTAQPARWRFPHGIGRGAQAIDSCVAAEFRGSLKKTGLFLTMARAWFDHFGRPERDQIVYGFPNPQAFRIGTRRLDYRPVHCPMPECSLPLAAARDWSPDGVAVFEVEDFGLEVDAFDEFLAPHQRMSCVRDAKALNWRYASCPTTRYRILRAEAPGGALRGFLVVTLGWHGDQKDLVPLVDWLVEPGDADTWQALLGHAARLAEPEGLGRFLAWAPPHHQVAADLESLGFATADSRFHLCIRIFCDDFTVADAVRDWYVLMGDSDIY